MEGSSYFVTELGIHVHNCTMIGNGAFLASGAALIKGDRVAVAVLLQTGIIFYSIGQASDLKELAEDAAFTAAISILAPPAVRTASKAWQTVWFGKQMKPARDTIILLRSKFYNYSDTNPGQLNCLLSHIRDFSKKWGIGGTSLSEIKDVSSESIPDLIRKAKQASSPIY